MSGVPVTHEQGVVRCVGQVYTSTKKGKKLKQQLKKQMYKREMFSSKPPHLVSVHACVVNTRAAHVDVVEARN